MRRRTPLRATVALLLLASPGAVPLHAGPPDAWAQFRTPAAGAPESIGKYTAGCVVGAAPLAADEPGLVHMRPQRRRNFGHPNLLAFLRTLAARMRAAGHGSVLVGDLGQARGGPTPTGHISHQSGLDVDIWFLVAEQGREPDAAARRDMPAPSYVDWSARRLDAGFGPAQAALVEHAARHPEVQRVLVNPIIKRRLCETAGADRAWLRKVRPWWGHADHLHVRLRCPPSDRRCTSQAPPPAGDGCGAPLQWWLSSAADTEYARRREAARERQPVTLPAACEALTSAVSATPTRPGSARRTSP